MLKINLDNPEIYGLVLKICKRYAVEPSMSLESEKYFADLLSGYAGPNTKAELAKWLHQKLAQDFVWVKTKPKWIQGAAWPMPGCKPLIFAGQIDIPAKNSKSIFHDTTTIYVFLCEGISPKIVIQQI